MPIWGSYRLLGRPASRLTPLLHCQSTPAHQSRCTLHRYPPLLNPTIYVFPRSSRPSMVRPTAKLHTRITFPLPVWPFDQSDICCDYDTIGALCENTSLSIPAYTSSFSLHSPPSLPCLPPMYNIVLSRHGDEVPLSQVRSREYDRGTLHLPQQLVRNSGEEIPQPRWRVRRYS